MVPKCEQRNTKSQVLLVTCLTTIYNECRIIFPVNVSYSKNCILFSKSCYCSFDRVLFNSDEMHLGRCDTTKSHLCFESRFESGNLRKAIQVSQEYQLCVTCWNELLEPPDSVTDMELVDQPNDVGF
jgi:hypothetical protein